MSLQKDIFLCLTVTEMRQFDEIHGAQAQGLDGDQTAWVSCIPSPLIRLETCLDTLASV